MLETEVLLEWWQADGVVKELLWGSFAALMYKCIE